MRLLYALILCCLSLGTGYSQTNAYVSTTGIDFINNSINGCTDPLNPCKTIQHAIDYTPTTPNSGTGVNINISFGDYYEGNIEVDRKDVTIIGNGATVTGRMQVLEDPNNWTPVSSVCSGGVLPSGMTIYMYDFGSQSVSSNFSGKIRDSNGKFITLIEYNDYNDFIADKHGFHKSQYYYAGPGIYYCDNQLYLRIDQPEIDVIGGGVDLTAYDFSLSSTNPSATIYIGNKNYGFDVSADGFKVSNIELSTYSSSNLILRTKVKNTIIDNNTIIVNNYGIIIGEGEADEDEGENHCYSAYDNGNITDGYTYDYNENITITNNKITAYFPRWVAWFDIKRGERKIARNCQMGGIQVEGGWKNSEVLDNCFEEIFDGIIDIQPNYITETSPPTAHLRSHDISILRNRMIGIYDDALQLGTGTWNYEFAYNYIEGAGPSHHGTGPTDLNQQGKKYIHHNIIDATKLSLLWKRTTQLCHQTPGSNKCVLTTDPDENIQNVEAIWNTQIPFPTHEGKKNDIGELFYQKVFDPWKIYHNTVIFGENGYAPSNSRVGEEGFNANYFCNGDEQHEVYNNIFIQTIAGKPISRLSHFNNNSTNYDGNVWWSDDILSTQYTMFASWKDALSYTTNYSQNLANSCVDDNECFHNTSNKTFKVKYTNTAGNDAYQFGDIANLYVTNLNDLPLGVSGKLGIVVDPQISNNSSYLPLNPKLTDPMQNSYYAFSLYNSPTNYIIPALRLPQGYPTNPFYRGAVPYDAQGNLNTSIITNIPINHTCRLSSTPPSNPPIEQNNILNINLKVSPNPFTNSTQIQYDLPTESSVKCMVYNHLGILVGELNDEFQTAGQYQLTWDGKTNEGINLPSGLYVIVLQTETETISQKVILQR